MFCSRWDYQVYVCVYRMRLGNPLMPNNLQNSSVWSNSTIHLESSLSLKFPFEGFMQFPWCLQTSFIVFGLLRRYLYNAQTQQCHQTTRTIHTTMDSRTWVCPFPFRHFSGDKSLHSFGQGEFAWNSHSLTFLINIFRFSFKDGKTPRSQLHGT